MGGCCFRWPKPCPRGLDAVTGEEILGTGRWLLLLVALLTASCVVESPGTAPETAAPTSEAALGAATLPELGPLRTISGQVSGLSSGDRVLIVIRGHKAARATTRLEGVWEALDLPRGTYEVHPIHERYVFVPSSRRVVLGPRDAEGVDFSARLLGEPK